MRKTIAVLMLAALLLSATNPYPQYSVTKSFSSSAQEIVTVQLPAHSLKSVLGGSISVDLDAPASLCFSLNGAAATATQVTPVPSTVGPDAIAQGYTSSNVGSGTTIRCYTLQSGSFNFYAAPDFYLWKELASPGGGATPYAAVQNFTATLTPMSGTISGHLALNWGEQ